MKITAIKRIETGPKPQDHHNPEATFEVDDKEGQRLIKLGVACAAKDGSGKSEDDNRLKGPELIELIKSCKTAEEITHLIDGEKRVTVLDAAAKKIEELSSLKG